MSDREKGILAALQEIFPNVTHSYCCQHIANNIQQRFGMKCQSLFWACAQARYIDLFEEALKALAEKDIHARNYVNAINHQLWANYAFRYSRYGHDTNNITESVNSQ